MLAWCKRGGVAARVLQVDRLQKRLADTEAALTAREQALKEGSKETSRCAARVQDCFPRLLLCANARLPQPAVLSGCDCHGLCCFMHAPSQQPAAPGGLFDLPTSCIVRSFSV